MFAGELEASSLSESKCYGETTKDSGFDTAEKSYRIQEVSVETYFLWRLKPHRNNDECQEKLGYDV